MNATEQRAHTTVTPDVAQRVVRLEGVVVAFADRLDIQRANLRTAFAQIEDVRRDFYNLQARPFWGRLRWLLTGR